MSDQIPEWAAVLAKEFDAARDAALADFAEFINESQRCILRDCIQDAFQPVLSRVIKQIATASDTPQHSALLELIDANHRANQIIGKQAEEMKALQDKIEVLKTERANWRQACLRDTSAL